MRVLLLILLLAGCAGPDQADASGPHLRMNGVYGSFGGVVTR